MVGMRYSLCSASKEVGRLDRLYSGGEAKKAIVVYRRRESKAGNASSRQMKRAASRDGGGLLSPCLRLLRLASPGAPRAS
jgi:hypothetical protein